MAPQLLEIVSTLKQGNLHKLEVTFAADLNSLSEQLKNALVEYTELDTNAQDFIPEFTSRKRSSKSYDLVNLSSVLKDLRELNLDVFRLEDLPTYVYSMLLDFDLLNQFDIPKDKLQYFVSEIREHYELWANPYHNFLHGFNVMHISYIILACTPADELYSAHDILAILIGSLCHDVQHTGRTNAFEMNRQSQLAILYNDNSVLENHHAAMTFKILQDEKTNIFCNLSPELLKPVRKLMISSILATDMAMHFPMVNEMNSRIADLAESPLGTRKEDPERFARLLVHSADLGHPCVALELYQMWSQKVCEEFTRQFNDEVELGLPPTELMKDLGKLDVYYDKEHGFLKFVVLPLWNCMNLWLQPHGSQFIEQLNSNIEAFAAFKEKYKREEGN